MMWMIRGLPSLLACMLVVLCTRDAGAVTWCGDLGCDGRVTSTDALLLLRIAVGGEGSAHCPLDCDAYVPTRADFATASPGVGSRDCADLDCNGTVTVADALALLARTLDPEAPLSCAPSCGAGGAAFEEVTSASGIIHEGDSWGGAWGDYDGDGWTDVAITNHFERTTLFRNLDGTSFEDVTTEVMEPVPVRNDSHAMAWADFDEDGDLDLFEQIGGGGGTASASKPMPKLLWVNEGGRLFQRSADYGVDYPFSRGRGVAWLDYDFDGLLDLLLLTELRPDRLYPSAIFRQEQGGGFSDVTAALAFDVPLTSKYANVCDLRGDGTRDIVIHGGHFPQRIYRAGTAPLLETRKQLGFPTTDLVEDSAIGDFDGDEDVDFFVVRNLATSEVSWQGGAVVRAFLFPYLTTEEQGFVVRTSGDLSVHLEASQLIDPELVHIGATGYHPANGQSFELLASDPQNHGIVEHVSGTLHGVIIGFDPQLEEWTVVVGVPPAEPKQRLFNIEATSNGGVLGVTYVNIDNETKPPANRLLVNTGTAFVNGTAAAGLNFPSYCHSVASADFDNDADLDLYLVCTRRTINFPNLLLENRGDGTFVVTPHAGGAQGSARGLGDVALVADYDRDGFLDLLVTNGHPLKPFNSDGPDQLYRNRGNDNHWLQLDLEGTQSSREAVGAIVRVSAGGVTQVRQTGCTSHKWGFDERIVHFGLGASESVDVVRIQWPSGVEQVLSDVAADQRLKVIEPAQ